jgi:hypothetical protein
LSLVTYGNCVRKLACINVVAAPCLKWMDVTAETLFSTRAGQVGFVVDDATLGLVFL